MQGYIGDLPFAPHLSRRRPDKAPAKGERTHAKRRKERGSGNFVASAERHEDGILKIEWEMWDDDVCGSPDSRDDVFAMVACT